MYLVSDLSYSSFSVLSCFQPSRWLYCQICSKNFRNCSENAPLPPFPHMGAKCVVDVSLRLTDFFQDIFCQDNEGCVWHISSSEFADSFISYLECAISWIERTGLIGISSFFSHNWSSLYILLQYYKYYLDFMTLPLFFIGYNIPQVICHSFSSSCVKLVIVDFVSTRCICYRGPRKFDSLLYIVL